MSLLMDALKRAEASKQDAARAITGSPRPAAGSLSLEARETPPLPDLAEHIAAVDADLAASAQPAPAPAADSGPETARNAFAAKAAPPSRRRGLALALGGLVLGAAAIGGYVWYQLANLGGSLAPAAASSQRPLPLPAAEWPVEQPPPPAAPLAAPPAAAARPILQPLPPAPPVAALPAAAAKADRPPPASPADPQPRPAEPTADAPVKVVRKQPEPDANVGRGWRNLQGGSLEAARRDYEQALKADPKNVDALLALAAIAQRQGRRGEADRYRQLALEADPKDAGAQAAILAGAAASDPQGAESRLKTLLAAQPESAPLNFALGNLLSRQGRWAEAQAAYFNAVAAEGDNPDYLFNLAVSLDHLRQPRLAAQHYRLALEAAEKRAATFNREQVAKRLLELQP